MIFDVLLSLAPTAPRELLERISGALAEQPAPDVLLLISEGLYEAAHEQEMSGHARAGDLRELAKVIAPSVMRERLPVSLVDQLHMALAGLVEHDKPPATPCDAMRTLVWDQAARALARANRELGGRRG